MYVKYVFEVSVFEFKIYVCHKLFFLFFLTFFKVFRAISELIFVSSYVFNRSSMEISLGK